MTFFTLTLVFGVLAACYTEVTATAITEPYANLQEAIDDGYYYLEVDFKNEATCNSLNADNINGIYIKNYSDVNTCSGLYNIVTYNLKTDTLPDTIQHAFEIIFQVRYYKHGGYVINTTCSDSVGFILGFGPNDYVPYLGPLSSLSNATCEQRVDNPNIFYWYGVNSSDIGTCIDFVFHGESVSLFCGNGNNWVKYTTTTTTTKTINTTTSPTTILPTSSSASLSTGEIVGIAIGGLAGALIVVFVIYWFCFRKQTNRSGDYKSIGAYVNAYTYDLLFV